MKRAFSALGAAFVLAGAGCGGSTSARSHGILLVEQAKYGKSRIYRWNPGSRATPLGKPAYGIVGPAWSPDGRSIAWLETVVPEGGAHPESDGISVMRSDGTQVKLLADDDYSDGAPSWSPDGRSIAYEREELRFDSQGTWEVFPLVIVDVRSGHERVFHPDLCCLNYPGDPVWGEPGIAYENHSGMMLLDPATGRSTRLARGQFVEDPAWSPDGVLAAVESKRIVLLAASGRVLGRLPIPSPFVEISWSPSGVLAVAEPTRIVLLSASGRVLGKLPTPVAIRPAQGPDWTPDGRQIDVWSGKANGGLWRVTVGTKRWRRFVVPTVGGR